MKSLRWNDDFWETELFIPVFSKEITIYVYREDESEPTERQLEILSKLAALPESVVSEINLHAVNYADDVNARVNLKSEDIAIDRAEIYKHYTINNITIPEIFECDDDYLIISSDCDWDEEHGMEILIENNTVLSCTYSRGLAFNPAWEDVVNSPREGRNEFLKELLEGN